MPPLKHWFITPNRSIFALPDCGLGGRASRSSIARAGRKEDLIFHSENPGTWQGRYLMPFTRLNTRNIDRLGGTILQSTRTNPANTRVSDLPPHLAFYGAGHKPGDRVDLTGEVLANLEFLELDGLVVIGGDDTLSFGAVLAARGVPVLTVYHKSGVNG